MVTQKLISLKIIKIKIIQMIQIDYRFKNLESVSFTYQFILQHKSVCTRTMVYVMSENIVKQFLFFSGKSPSLLPPLCSGWRDLVQGPSWLVECLQCPGWCGSGRSWLKSFLLTTCLWASSSPSQPVSTVQRVFSRRRRYDSLGMH